jgi:hypothetical protein
VFSRSTSRAAYVLAKFSMYTLVLLGALSIGAAATLYYTVLLFPQAVVGPFVLANLGVGMLLLDILSITLLCSTIIPAALGAGGAVFGIYLALYYALAVVDPAPGPLAMERGLTCARVTGRDMGRDRPAARAGRWSGLVCRFFGGRAARPPALHGLTLHQL